MTVQRGTQLGRYRLESLLGTGGMAEVWKATMQGAAGFERTVVVKRVLSHLARDASFVKMFLAEAKLSAQLQHPNIVQVHELGQEGNEFYMAMEYVKGCDLGWVLRRGVDVPIGFSVLVVQSVGRALGHAHASQLIHRDVTPSNIMLGHEGTVKLLDFGIAKALTSSENRTETGTLKGKLGYMAPEHVDGQPLDPRSDLFAAGVVLHELLTGYRLFKGASDFETLSLMRTANVEPPSKFNSAVPPELDAICLKALARDPAARYASADAFVEALEPFLDGWNTDRLRRMMVELLAEQARSAHGPVTMTAEPSPRETPRRNLRWAVVAGALAVVCAGGFGVYKLTRSEAAVAVAAPVVTSEPVPPPKREPEPLKPEPPKPEPPKPEPEPVTKATPGKKRIKRPPSKKPPSTTTPAASTFDPESALP